MNTPPDKAVKPPREFKNVFSIISHNNQVPFKETFDKDLHLVEASALEVANKRLGELENSMIVEKAFADTYQELNAELNAENKELVLGIGRAANKLTEAEDQIESQKKRIEELVETHINMRVIFQREADTLKSRLALAVSDLKENLIYLAINNPEDKKCDACEPGNAYEPEFICGVHKLIIKTQETLAKITDEQGKINLPDGRGK